MFLSPNYSFIVSSQITALIISYQKRKRKLASNELFVPFPDGMVVKNGSANAGDVRDVGSIPRSGRSPGGGNGNPLQYSCLENPVDGGAWGSTVHGVAKSQTRLSMLTRASTI